METMSKLLVLLLFLINTLGGQTYILSVFDFHIGDLIKTNPAPNQIELNFQSRGIYDVFYPTKNIYKTTYNSKTFMLEKYQYEIDQINLKKTFTIINGSVLTDSSHKNNFYSLPSPAFNFSSFIEYLKSKNISEFDAIWFPYEAGKKLGKIRAVWADSTNIFNKKDSVMCNHYRLDIKVDNASEIKEIDYLSEILINEENVKEVWISIKSPEIYSMKISNSFLTLDLKINL